MNRFLRTTVGTLPALVAEMDAVIARRRKTSFEYAARIWLDNSRKFVMAHASRQVPQPEQFSCTAISSTIFQLLFGSILYAQHLAM